MNECNYCKKNSFSTLINHISHHFLSNLQSYYHQKRILKTRNVWIIGTVSCSIEFESLPLNDFCLRCRSSKSLVSKSLAHQCKESHNFQLYPILEKINMKKVMEMTNILYMIFICLVLTNCILRREICTQIHVLKIFASHPYNLNSMIMRGIH